LLLPNVPDTRDACVVRLRDLLEAKEGIDATHLLEAEGERPDRVCVHFDPSRLSLGEVRELARRAGAQLEHRFGHLLLKTLPMHARQARTRSERLEQVDGVLEATFSPDGVVRIEFDREQVGAEEALAAVRRLGVRLVEEKRRRKPEVAEPERPEAERAEHEHGGVLGENSELIFAALCGVMLLVGWLLSVLTQVVTWIPWTFYVASYFLGGYYTAREAIEKLRARRFEIDFLMLVAAIGAATLGQWAEGALLLFLFSLGHSLEHYAMGRARRAIEALAELAPDTALVRRDGQVEEVPVEELERGDVVVVKPNERIPADGFITQGNSSVDQSPVTGESVPVDKQPVANPQDAARRPEKLAQVTQLSGSVCW
jgi:Cd2+/Zn2+-exporting ATPase